MQERLRDRGIGFAARLGGAAVLALALSGCASDKPWWEGGRAASHRGEVDAEPLTSAGSGGTYVVRSGDTLFKVSRDKGVPIRSLIDANDLEPPYALRTGQRLVIPGGRYHVVQKGDTVYSISRTYGVDMATLTSTNHIPAPYKIRLGQRLQLPSRVNRQVAVRDVETAAPPHRAATVTSAPAATDAAQAAAPTTPRGNAVVASTEPKGPLPTPPTPAGDFIWPIKGPVISSYGPKEGGLHNDGVNIAVPVGSPVKAAQSGVVAYAGNELKGYGNLLLIRHANGWMTAYAHNSKLLVKRGDTVVKGQTICLSGSSGSVTSPQVHFEIRKGAKAVDPRGVIEG
ncbi:LysM peptidoglycan-binding domain-containing M23 family metallopeptidase [Parvibaculum sp.]|uniref:LysM peptidoglycan-binding domain-containing M23 family metallopeptidase n=1 Tax=Parvibaculum sp. TaxID=2024848 RepID=UPI00320FB000